MKFFLETLISFGVILNLLGNDLEEKYQNIDWQNKSNGTKLSLRISKAMCYKSSLNSFTVYNKEISVTLRLEFQPAREYTLVDLKRFEKSFTELMTAGNWKLKSVTDFKDDYWQGREIYGIKTEEPNNFICVLIYKKNFFLVFSAMSNKLEDYKICKSIIQEIISYLSITTKE